MLLAIPRSSTTISSCFRSERVAAVQAQENMSILAAQVKTNRGERDALPAPNRESLGLPERSRKRCGSAARWRFRLALPEVYLAKGSGNRCREALDQLAFDRLKVEKL